VLHIKIGKVRLKFDFKFIFNLQKEAIPLGMFFIILTVFSYIDIVMLSKMSPDFNAAGLYGAAFRIYEGITILPTILFLVALPRLSDLYVNDEKRHQELAFRVVKYMFIMAMPIVVYGYFFSNFFMQMFYSSEPDFFEAAFALQLLFIGIMFQYPNWMLNTILISIDKQKIIMYIGLIALVCKVILNLIVIPRFGYEGAAAATVFGEAMIFGLSTLYLAWHRIRIPVARISFKPLLISGILTASFHFGTQYLSLIPLGIILAFVYIGLLFALRTFDKAEINGLKDNILAFTN
jgi:O-antigen/teichoic acid export membrane protein